MISSNCNFLESRGSSVTGLVALALRIGSIFQQGAQHIGLFGRIGNQRQPVAVLKRCLDRQPVSTIEAKPWVKLPRAVAQHAQVRGDVEVARLCNVIGIAFDQPAGRAGIAPAAKGSDLLHMGDLMGDEIGQRPVCQ